MSDKCALERRIVADLSNSKDLRGVSVPVIAAAVVATVQWIESNVPYDTQAGSFRELQQCEGCDGLRMPEELHAVGFEDLVYLCDECARPTEGDER